MCQCFQTMKNNTWFHLWTRKNYFLNVNFSVVLINMKLFNCHSFLQYIICVHHWPRSLILSNSLVKCKFFYQLTRHERVNFVQSISSIVTSDKFTESAYSTWLVSRNCEATHLSENQWKKIASFLLNETGKVQKIYMIWNSFPTLLACCYGQRYNVIWTKLSNTGYSSLKYKLSRIWTISIKRHLKNWMV